MKRCNNCGWFNPDSVRRCEKCDEESFELVVENQYEKDVDVVKPQESEKPKNNFANATIAYGHGGVNSPKSDDAPKSEDVKTTVIDSSNRLEGAGQGAPSSCPKCRYPISGNVEYCPNCGATIRSNSRATIRTQLITEADVNTTVSVESENFDPRATVIINNLKPEVKTKDSKASSGNLKATVRDVPEELIVDNKDCYRLVPVDGLGEAIIELNIGEEVVVAGRRYKFQK